MSADIKNCLNLLLPVCPVHIVVIADNVFAMHVHRCAYNSCNTVQYVHMPMSTSESWFTFNHACIFSDFSTASPYCQHSADRKQSFHKCLRRRSRNQILSNKRQNWVNVCSFSCQNSMALPPNERVWMSAMYWLMWHNSSDGQKILVTINRSRRNSLLKT